MKSILYGKREACPNEVAILILVFQSNGFLSGVNLKEKSS
jgi:hypothetical protein